MRTLVLAAAFSTAAASSALGAGLNVLFYDAPNGAVAGLADATAIAAGAPTVGFTATALSYGTAPGFLIGSLGDFIGVDAASLDDPAAASLSFAESVLTFSGFIRLVSGENLFSITSDDGFALSVGGAPLASFDGTRPPGATTTAAFIAPADGFYAFELLYYEAEPTQAQLLAQLNGAVIDASITTAAIAPVPTPPAIAAMALALVGLVFVGRRRHR